MKLLKDLKDYLSSAPALMKPVKGESLILYLVVSGNAVSVVLVKDHEGQQHPVYYVSKSHLDAEARNAIKSQAIADFVADFTSDLHVQAYFEVQKLDETKDHWILYTDGASNVKGTVKGEKLVKYLEIVKILAEYFDGFSITHVPREENAMADSLANLASSLKIPNNLKIPIIHIIHPVIDERRIIEIDSGNQLMDPSSSQAQQGS
ncbi:hypothetical protein QVD17_37751 [Tagetes erecta]|uniref:RNase H type-1 domain-containing protein n=1 Tax=Tagetes erecta TaxID=13708 RepID=A0AAD8K146_TARER|nr:hypothetical protein QVD17_37751 [Tagetes erecta]